MEKFLNQFLRLRPIGNSTLPLYDYDKPISMDTTNDKSISFSKNLTLSIYGGTTKLKKGDDFDLKIEVGFVAKDGKQTYEFNKIWKRKEPVASVGEIVDFEALIKNLLALNYTIKGMDMFSEEEKWIRKLFKRKKEVDAYQVGVLKSNLGNILEGKPVRYEPEMLIGVEKMQEIISNSVNYAHAISLHNQIEQDPTKDL